VEHTFLFLGLAPYAFFSLIIICAICRKGDVRTGFGTSRRYFFLEVKERRDKTNRLLPRPTIRSGGGLVHSFEAAPRETPMMDQALVRMILTAIAENNPSQIQPGETDEAVNWIKERVWMTPRDKGEKAQHYPHLEAAALSAEKAISFFERGNADAARPLALEALRMLSG
jgi:hypothetical protein